MANQIALAENYLPLLDEVYKAASKTSVLDDSAAEFVNANTVKIYKLTMDGLGDYDRNAGFKQGSVNGTWETMTLTEDRATSFSVDRMDNEESINMAFGKLAGEFIRTKVVPEVDAYTFAKLAGTANISKATPADIVVGTTDVAALVDEADRVLSEDEVPYEGRILFISETAYAAMKSKIVREIRNGENGINTEVETYNGSRIVRVPQGRFLTAITLNDGTSAFGYTKASGAKKINFMLVHPSAIEKVTKHVLPRIFTPDENQQADAWKFDYRIYHDTFVEENKVAGIYLHTSVANA